MKRQPSYAYLSESDWAERIAAADALAAPCRLCPRRCRKNRVAGETGYCGAGGDLCVSSIFQHHGEEPPISGSGGSGTVFFSHCSLRCCFCQNYQISQENEGAPCTSSGLARKLVGLEAQGVHNINLVTATHFLPWVLRALQEAAGLGLSVPIVWNSSGYELVEALRPLHGVVDIYLPDMKYGANPSARRYCGARDYVEVNRAAVREMFRQVGPLALDAHGIAYRGMCIRHLVLPDGRAGSAELFAFLGSAFDPADLTVSLMAQYRPCYQAAEFEELRRGITRDEYQAAARQAELAGVTVFHQDLPGLDDPFCIDFQTRKEEPLTGR